MSFSERSISFKVNRVLNIIFLGLILIFIRVWYLAVIQHDFHQARSLKPQRRVVVERVERSGIYDRFGIPLAVNKIQYNAAVCYAQLREIPTNEWVKDEMGKKVRVPKRSQYIKSLAEILAQELDVSATFIEDLIHAKASLFPNTPFAIKEDISEEQYFRLRILEKDWPGIVSQRSSRRFYPQGKTGCDVVGYLGAISSQEYNRVAEEIKVLQEYLDARELGDIVILPKGFNSPVEVKKRLKGLKEKAYSINDLVGKAGIEAQFDGQLRGVFGRTFYEIDTKGNFLRQLPGSSSPISGERLHLSLSTELQAYAEKLLAWQEQDREGAKTEDALARFPWIRGGAIVAIIPKTGEVVAMASYPRFDPEDFLQTRDPALKRHRQRLISRWLENEHYIGMMWDGIIPLERERFSREYETYFDEPLPINWETYLKTILPHDSPVLSSLGKMDNVLSAISFQKNCAALLEISGQQDLRVAFDVLYPSSDHKKSRANASKAVMDSCLASLRSHIETAASLKKALDPFVDSIQHNDDKVLLYDLCHLCAPKEKFSEALLEKMGHISLSQYREECQAARRILYVLSPEARELFHTNQFQKWREENFKTYLAEKRKDEKKRKKAAKPYTEYLDEEERKQFDEYWSRASHPLLQAVLSLDHHIISTNPDLITLENCILQNRTILPDSDPVFRQLSKNIEELPIDLGLQYLRSFSGFDELKQPLAGKYPLLRHENKTYLEKHLASAFYPIHGFGYGRSQAFRQACPQGSVFKLIVAYVVLKERFDKISRTIRHLEELNPLTLIDDLKGDPKSQNLKQILGYTLDGEPIMRIYKGGLMPRSSHSNIGKVDMIGALEQSSNIYFSILAAEHLQDPLALTLAAREFGIGSKAGVDLPGEFGGKTPDDIQHNKTALYSLAIGQHSLITTPLQTAVMFSVFVNGGQVLKPQILHQSTRLVENPKADLFSLKRNFPFEETLGLCGISFPLFTETVVNKPNFKVNTQAVHVRNTIDFPAPIHEMIMEGMRKVMMGDRGTARLQAVRPTIHNPDWVHHYNELRSQMIGKTGTAQILYKKTVDAASKAQMHNHVWFAGALFDKEVTAEDPGEPELAVIVYLRHAEKGGREAAPLATEMMKKWREINEKHQ